MAKRRLSSLGQTAATVRERHGAETVEPIVFRRQLVADLCKLLGNQLPVMRSASTPAKRDAANPNGEAFLASPRHAEPAPPMAPRLRQTLELLLSGDSEKQIARKLSISPHTVHAYVKSLYRKFNVSSRGELLALWVRKSPS